MRSRSASNTRHGNFRGKEPILPGLWRLGVRGFAGSCEIKFHGKITTKDEILKKILKKTHRITCERNNIPKKTSGSSEAVDDFQFRVICSSSLPTKQGFPTAFRLANHPEKGHTSALTPSPRLQSRLQTSISCCVVSPGQTMATRKNAKKSLTLFTRLTVHCTPLPAKKGVTAGLVPLNRLNSSTPSTGQLM